ncbi:MAG: hypothetical protein HYX45_00630 [Burkholderiales bacterium]|nr:hypothetical protein [Burkholderiales bacterium]
MYSGPDADATAWAYFSGGALTLHATWDQLKLLPRMLRDELEVAMALCGCRTLEQIPPDLLWTSS